MNEPLILISCGAAKADYPAPARRFYRSVWSIKMRRYAEQETKAHGGNWYILSAAYGLVEPDQVLQPYDQTLYDLPPRAREAWAYAIVTRIRELHPAPRKVIILAGDVYRRYLDHWLSRYGYQIEAPLAGLGIGKQLAWLTRHTYT